MKESLRGVSRLGEPMTTTPCTEPVLYLGVKEKCTEHVRSDASRISRQPVTRDTIAIMVKTTRNANPPVTDLPDLPAFADALADRRFIAAVAIAALSGFVRGFSGFGSALIYIPLIAAVYEPRIAAPTLLLIDLCGSAPFTIREFPRCNWREVAPITIAAAIAVPFGTMALIVVDPIVLRWIISALVLSLLAVLSSGWRYRGRPTLPVTTGVGIVAGLGSGAVQIAGPAVIIFWLGGANNAATVRANLMVFFLLMGAITGAVYLIQGVLTADVLALSVLLGVPFVLAMWAGAHWFRGASEQTYRRAAYAIIVVAAIVSLPVFDRLMR